MVAESYFWVDSGDDCQEFIETNCSVSVFVCILDDLINLSTGEVLSHTGSCLLEFLWSKLSSSFCVKSFKDRLKSCLTASISSESEDIQEGREVNIANVS